MKNFLILVSALISLHGEVAFAEDVENWHTQLRNLNKECRSLAHEKQSDRALEISQKALDLAIKSTSGNSPEVAKSMLQQGDLYFSLRDGARAEKLFLGVRSIWEKSGGANNPAIGEALDSLALLYMRKGEFGKAEAFYLGSLSLREKYYGNSHEFVGISIYNLGSLYFKSEQYAQAEVMFQRALPIAERAAGVASIDAAVTPDKLSLAEIHLGKVEEADAIYQRMLNIGDTILVPGRTELAVLLEHLPSTYMTIKQYAKVEFMLQKSLPLLEQKLGKTDPFVVRNLILLSNCYVENGHSEQAEPLRVRAAEIVGVAGGALLAGSELKDASLTTSGKISASVDGSLSLKNH
jgi:tetratricopeptide (TPR) repeat protein